MQATHPTACLPKYVTNLELSCHIVAGTSHIVAVLMYTMHLRRTFSAKHDRYRYVQGAAVLHRAALCASILGLLIPLFQLNGRLGTGDTIAPFEWAGVQRGWWLSETTCYMWL